MKKTTNLMIAVLFLSFGIIAQAQEGRNIDQMKLSIEEQIQYLDGSIQTYNGIIRNMDEIIDTYQKQKITIIEERAKLVLYKEMLVSSRKAQLKTRGHGQDAVIAGAAAVGAAATGNFVAAAAAAATAVNKALDGAIESVEKKNEQIEQKLKEQREWHASHPGKKN